jgi:hypothetical protein
MLEIFLMVFMIILKNIIKFIENIDITAIPQNNNKYPITFVNIKDKYINEFVSINNCMGCRNV